MATGKIDPSNVAGQGVIIGQALLAGAAGATDIAVAGLSWKKSPKFIGAIRLEGSATYVAPVDLTAEVVKGTVDGAIRLTTATTGDFVLLTWAQKA